MALSSGTRLKQRYEILSNIKTGGMGSVFEARDTHLANSPCAVKELHETLLDGPRGDYLRATFEKEMQALAELDHPCIPRVRDYFEEGDKRYLVMDFLSGSTLEEELSEHQQITGRGIPPGRAVVDILSVLEIVDYLHNLSPSIVHRDIKPSNIIREAKSGRLKLVDFGLARPLEQDQTLPSRVGTLGYCAPEQLAGLADLRSDIYSLGATFYRMLTGRLPRLGSQALDLDLSNLRPGLEKIVAKATQPRASQRYAHVREMIADLRAWQDGSDLSFAYAPQTLEGSPQSVSQPQTTDQRAWAFMACLALGMGWLAGEVLTTPNFIQRVDASTPFVAPVALSHIGLDEAAEAAPTSHSVSVPRVSRPSRPSSQTLAASRLQSPATLVAPKSKVTVATASTHSSAYPRELSPREAPPPQVVPLFKQPSVVASHSVTAAPDSGNQPPAYPLAPATRAAAPIASGSGVPPASSNTAPPAGSTAAALPAAAAPPLPPAASLATSAAAPVVNRAPAAVNGAAAVPISASVASSSATPGASDSEARPAESAAPPERPSGSRAPSGGGRR